MRLGAIVQARYSSARLPGKVLRPLCGTPLIGHLLGRLRRCRALDLVILATSTEVSDDAIAAFAAEARVPCYRGPLEDVLGRFAGAVERFALDGAVRVSGDSPLLAPALVDRAVQIFRRGKWDLVTNVQVRSFPKGQSIEVIAGKALARAAAEAKETGEREHVTPYFYAHPERFRIRNIEAEMPRPALQLSVDTDEDFARVEAILRAAGARASALDLAETIALADALAAGDAV
jgi:spore coat polysaccharide biosynthesis protein SpsF